MSRAVFLDRDGTLIVQRHYLDDPDAVELIDGATEAIRRLHGAGFRVIVLTNQSGVARGYFGMDRVQAIHDRIQSLLAPESVDAFYVCPHAPDEACGCRKPAAGLIETAVHDSGIDLENSWMIGDKACDVDCGRNAGVFSILVRTGYGVSEESEAGGRATAVVDDLSAAVDWILEHTREA